MTQYVSVGRYTIKDIKMVTRGGNGLPVTPDMNPLATLRLTSDDTEIASRASFHVVDDPVGTWTVTLSSEETANPGLYYVRWSWELDGISQTYRTDISVSSVTTEVYDSLPDEAQAIVGQIWDVRLADLFDSALGGPHLQEYAQTHFGPGRIASLVGIAMEQISSSVQADTGWHLNDSGGYPYAEWRGLLAQATWIETLKHLRRSYLEQPTPQGVQVARLDRKDYSREWAAVLQDEIDTFRGMLSVFKIKMAGLGRMSVLVEGGIYPKWSSYPTMPARGRGLPPFPRAGW